MITTRLRYIRRATLIGSSFATTAFLLLNLHAFLAHDLRPTIISNAITICTAACWITFALVCVGLYLVAVLDKMRITRDLSAPASTPRRPDHLHLVASVAATPRRFPLSIPVAAGLLLSTVALLVALVAFTPQHGTGNAGGTGAAAQQLPAATVTSSVTVTVTADTPVADTDQPGPMSPRHSAPAPTSATTPPAPTSDGPAATTTAPLSTAKTKRSTPAPQVSTTPPPTGSASVSTTPNQDGSANPQTLSN